MAVQKDAIGVSIELTLKNVNDVVVDISSATVKRIDFRTPNSVLLQKTAAFVTDGVNGKIQYVTIAGDLDIGGTWLMQAYIEMGGFKGFSTSTPLIVTQNI